MSQPTQTDAIMDERQAFAAGLGATVVALFLSYLAFRQVISVFADVFVLLIALALLGAFAQFWASKAYKDGLTTNELMLAILWPVDMVKSIREGVNRQQVVSNFRTNLPAQHDDSKTLVNERVALGGGIALTIVVCVFILPWGILSALGVAFQLIWVALLISAVMFVVNFWTSKAYKNGLSVSEIIMLALWPVDLWRNIRAGVVRQNSIP